MNEKQPGQRTEMEMLQSFVQIISDDPEVDNISEDILLLGEHRDMFDNAEDDFHKALRHLILYKNKKRQSYLDQARVTAQVAFSDYMGVLLSQTDRGERQFWAVYNTIKITDIARVELINVTLGQKALPPIDEEQLFEKLSGPFSVNNEPPTDEMYQLASGLYENCITVDLQTIYEILY